MGLPPFSVRARNTATDSANRIHSDEVARQYGFRGGLVPGVTVWAYLSHPVVEAWGRDWLEGGSMKARFLRPLYDGEEATVAATDAGAAHDAGATQPDRLGPMTLALHDSAGELCATAEASLGSEAGPGGGATPMELMAGFAEAPLPSEPPAASAEVLEGLAVLGTHSVAFDASRARAYLDAIGEDLPVYRDQGLAHPGWLLHQANTALTRNVVLGPWIHASSAVHNLEAVEDGARLSVRGRPKRVYERKGHRLVDLELLYVRDGSVPVMHVEHTAIYEPRTG